MKKHNHKNQIKKEKKIVLVSSLSSFMSFLGGWQVCHNICLVIIALLSVIGISVTGMPLFFLTQYATYFWSAALLLLVPTSIMYYRHRECMSTNLILFNAGIIIFSVPFVQELNLAFWAVGGAIILFVAASFLKSRMGK